MLRQVIVDTSILVALIDQRDRHHEWARQQLGGIAPPLLTCEAVISEAWFLLKRVRNGREALLLLLEQDQISVEFDLNAELLSVVALMRRYEPVPTALIELACAAAVLRRLRTVLALMAMSKTSRSNSTTPRKELWQISTSPSISWNSQDLVIGKWKSTCSSGG